VDQPEIPYEKEFPYPLVCHFEKPPKNGSYDVAIFYHVGMMNNWKTIVTDQLQTLQKCGLGDMASSLTVTYSIKDSENSTLDDLTKIIDAFRFSKELTISYIEATEVPWEQEAMEAISRSCVHSHLPGEKKIVYYFHNKGVSHYSENWRDQCNSPDFNYCKAIYWIKYMEWFLLEKPTLCLRAVLYHGASTCGVNLFSWPSWHYSGNFWAASCSWIQNLLPIGDTEEEFLYLIAAELWIGNQSSTELNFATDQHIGFDFFGRVSGYRRNVPYQTAMLPEQYANETDHALNTRYSELWLDYLANKAA